MIEKRIITAWSSVVMLINVMVIINNTYVKQKKKTITIDYMIIYVKIIYILL